MHHVEEATLTFADRAAAAFSNGAPMKPPDGVLSAALLPPQLIQKQASREAPPPRANTSMAQSVADISQGLLLMHEAHRNGGYHVALSRGMLVPAVTCALALLGSVVCNARRP